MSEGGYSDMQIAYVAWLLPMVMIVELLGYTWWHDRWA